MPKTKTIIVIKPYMFILYHLHQGASPLPYGAFCSLIFSMHGMQFDKTQPAGRCRKTTRRLKTRILLQRKAMRMPVVCLGLCRPHNKQARASLTTSPG